LTQGDVFDDSFIFDENDADADFPKDETTNKSALNWGLVADKTSNFWTGKIYMGQQREEMNIVFDTTSDWLAIEGHLCEECTGNVFDTTKSETAVKVGTEESER
jgi:hypothetical protein